MKSPFPGMDPYLQHSWGDVHQAIVTYTRDWLQSRLPGDLRGYDDIDYRDEPDPPLPEVARGGCGLG